jgi:hypothetical protein
MMSNTSKEKLIDVQGAAAAEKNFSTKRLEREGRWLLKDSKIKKEAYHKKASEVRGSSWTLFSVTYPCLWTLGEYPALAGSNSDGGKWLCGFEEIAQSKRPCVVYSFGHAGNAMFELSVKVIFNSATPFLSILVLLCNCRC